MNVHMFWRSISAIVLLAWAGAPVALGQHGDVWLSTDLDNGKLTVGVVDEAGTTYKPGVRVFEAVLTLDSLPFSPFDFSAEDPGFRSAAGDLPAGQTVSLTNESLRVWNGSGLDPVLGVDFNFDLASGLATGADGSLHGHPLFGLTSSTSPLADGVYVAAFRASTPGLSASDPIYLVMLKDDVIATEDDVEGLELLLEEFDDGGPEPIFNGKNFAFFEEAVEFVASAVPEPSGAMLAVGAAVAVAATRRRRPFVKSQSVARQSAEPNNSGALPLRMSLAAAWAHTPWGTQR